MLYEAASGRLPFEGRTCFEISAAIMREIPSSPGPPVPPGLWATIQRCLTKEPMQRYQRAGEVQAALEAIQGAVDDERLRRFLANVALWAPVLRDGVIVGFFAKGSGLLPPRCISIVDVPIHVPSCAPPISSSTK